jgi:predicted N-formylglutamate amidohydrolase
LKTNNCEIRKALLSLDDALPYITLNPNSITPVLLVCDHASNRFPKSLGTMGLDYIDRVSHITFDIGSRATTESLAIQLNATAILCQYSRLIVDCNRNLSDNSAFLDTSDGINIPGNQNLNDNEKEIRESEIYWPYHNAIDCQISRLKKHDANPLIISIHSFTPIFNGNNREWEIGVLWDKDPATAKIFISKLKDAGFLVGDNKPYSGKDPEDFTLDYHAEKIGLPHVGIEIRQDLINHDDGVERISNTIQEVISSLVLANKSSNIHIESPLR